jgi:hypothetical protein
MANAVNVTCISSIGFTMFYGLRFVLKSSIQFHKYQEYQTYCYNATKLIDSVHGDKVISDVMAELLNPCRTCR